MMVNLDDPPQKAILTNFGAVCGAVPLHGEIDSVQCPRGLADFRAISLHYSADKCGPASASTGSYPWCILAGEWEKRGQRVTRFAGKVETTVPCPRFQCAQYCAPHRKQLVTFGSKPVVREKASVLAVSAYGYNTVARRSKLSLSWLGGHALRLLTEGFQIRVLTEEPVLSLTARGTSNSVLASMCDAPRCQQIKWLAKFRQKFAALPSAVRKYKIE